jgi:hypothetical protein
MSEETTFNLLTPDQANSTPQLVPDAGPQARSPIPVTAGIPISDSGGQLQRVFLSVAVPLGTVDPRFRVILSSLPDTNAPIIIDDSIVVNGHHYNGFAGVTTNPKLFLGQNPEVCYKPVDFIDITKDLRTDGMVFIDALDVGGAVFCCSRLYIRIVPQL